MLEKACDAVEKVSKSGHKWASVMYLAGKKSEFPYLRVRPVTAVEEQQLQGLRGPCHAGRAAGSEGHFVRGDGLSARRISPSGACGVLSGACSGLFPRAPGP